MQVQPAVQVVQEHEVEVRQMEMEQLVEQLVKVVKLISVGKLVFDVALVGEARVHV